MKHRKLITVLFFVLGTLSAKIQAQETILASGGNTSPGIGSVSYSVGQVFFTTFANAGGTLLQGVQQPCEIFLIPDDDSTGVKISCLVFPNPASDVLTVKLLDYTGSASSYQLFNTYGQLIEKKRITTNPASISIGQLLPATYLLKILKDDKEVKAIKVIKTKAR